MSGATYRTEIDHLPGEVFAYYGKVYLVADDFAPAFTAARDTWEAADAALREWVQLQIVKQPTSVQYLDEFGQPVPAPDTHSVKA